MTILIAFVPVGLAVLAYVLAFETRQSKIHRLDRALRHGGTVVLPVRHGKWIY